MSETQTRPADYNLHDTPARWLAWVHFDDSTSDDLRKITSKAAGILGIMEAHSALAVLRLHRSGVETFRVGDIAAESGIGITSSRIKSLAAKGILAKREAPDHAVKLPGKPVAWWGIDPAAVPVVEKIEARLQSYIDHLAAAAAKEVVAA